MMALVPKSPSCRPPKKARSRCLTALRGLDLHQVRGWFDFSGDITDMVTAGAGCNSWIVIVANFLICTRVARAMGNR
jgi:hypothetical protein